MDARTLCLGALFLGDATGYEIRKLFEAGPFAHFHAISFGSIYPALNQLHADGLVALADADGRADRKVYRLTDAGRAAFAEALDVAPAPDRLRSETCFQLYFADALPPERVAALVDAYRDRFATALARMETLQRDGAGHELPGRRFTRGLGMALYDAAVRYLDANRDALLADLDANRDTEDEP